MSHGSYNSEIATMKQNNQTSSKWQHKTPVTIQDWTKLHRLVPPKISSDNRKSQFCSTEFERYYPEKSSFVHLLTSYSPDIMTTDVLNHTTIRFPY